MDQPELSHSRIKVIFIGLFSIAGFWWIFWGPIPIPDNLSISKGDFTAYWSAAYLLAHSQNFSDSALLMHTEQTLANWDMDFALKTWNPPWLLPLLLPYTLFTFERAAWLWFLTNIFLIFTGAIFTWLACAEDTAVKQKAWIGPLIAVFFAPTLTTLYMGQVNTLVFFGLALALFAEVRERPLLTGFGLSLTMVKPHLAYLTIPVLLLRALYMRQWRIPLGFGVTLLLLTGITFLLRPTFFGEYLASASGGDLLNWVTPTLGGFLMASAGWRWATLMGIIILPVVIVWWWRQRDSIPLAELLQITLLISVITAPFGWGYDVIVLLIPLIQIVVWVLQKSYSGLLTGGFILGLLLLNTMIFYHRTVMESEVEVFWVPVGIAVLYFGARFFKYRNHAVT